MYVYPFDNMAYNMYKQIGKIRESLDTKGYSKDIPTEIFCKELMLIFGMRRKTAIEWTDTFEDVNLISVKMEKVNFV